MNNELERLAREWAERTKTAPGVKSHPGLTAAIEHILDSTTPPTMADVEWDEAEHSETLVAEQDYENALEGTVVAQNECSPHVKKGRGFWQGMFSSIASDEMMAGTSRKVLRWGWGE